MDTAQLAAIFRKSQGGKYSNVPDDVLVGKILEFDKTGKYKNLLTPAVDPSGTRTVSGVGLGEWPAVATARQIATTPGVLPAVAGLAAAPFTGGMSLPAAAGLTGLAMGGGEAARQIIGGGEETSLEAAKKIGGEAAIGAVGTLLFGAPGLGATWLHGQVAKSPKILTVVADFLSSLTGTRHISSETIREGIQRGGVGAKMPKITKAVSEEKIVNLAASELKETQKRGGETLTRLQKRLKNQRTFIGKEIQKADDELVALADKEMSLAGVDKKMYSEVGLQTNLKNQRLLIEKEIKEIDDQIAGIKAFPGFHDSTLKRTQTWNENQRLLLGKKIKKIDDQHTALADHGVDLSGVANKMYDEFYLPTLNNPILKDLPGTKPLGTKLANIINNPVISIGDAIKTKRMISQVYEDFSNKGVMNVQAIDTLNLAMKGIRKELDTAIKGKAKELGFTGYAKTYKKFGNFADDYDSELLPMFGAKEGRIAVENRINSLAAQANAGDLRLEIIKDAKAFLPKDVHSKATGEVMDNLTDYIVLNSIYRNIATAPSNFFPAMIRLGVSPVIKNVVKTTRVTKPYTPSFVTRAMTPGLLGLSRLREQE